MSTIFMSKPDDFFVATATDPTRRSTAIADLTKKHRRLSSIATIFILVSVGICIYFSTMPTGPVILAVLVPLILLFKCESDLRLFRVIEKLQSYDRPVAS